MVRIVWNGNNLGGNGTASSNAEYDAVTPAVEWMVENGSTVVNTGDDAYSLLDAVGYVTTPSSGYTEDGLGGATAQLHGPFQRWMIQGQRDDGSAAKKAGRRVHVMRYCMSCQFACGLLCVGLSVVAYCICGCAVLCRCSGSFTVRRMSRR